VETIDDKLAERSGRETRQVAELIAQVQSGTRGAVGAMDSGAARVQLGSEKAALAGRALDEILKAVQDTVRQVGEIASASQLMAGGARTVTDAMHSISAAAEQVSASTEQMNAQVEQMTAQAQELASTADHLRHLVAQFKVGDAAPAAAGPRRSTARPVIPLRRIA
jgi:methyl-accepting chemotaxis protein